jgi:hypothetical protein
MDYLSYLVYKYSKVGVIFDTNILLLYFCGLHDQRLIGSFKRLLKFTLDDFYLLCHITTIFTPILTTPHILAEMSNLLDGVDGRVKEQAYTTFAKQLAVLQEEFIPAVDIVKTDCFGKLGLTDSGIRVLSERGFLVLTEDFPLLCRLQNHGMDALNFNNLRGMNWFGLT